MAIVELENLTKDYKTLRAVDSLSFTLDEGDIFGFIGPNGAGKTTTIKMLATLLAPTTGVARICGHDAYKDPMAVRAVIGYMPDFFGVYDDIKVWEYLDFFAAAYKIDRDKRPQIIDDVLELTDLTTKKDAFVEELSRGMKQRLCLAKTLVHDPKVLLLDEPASGLDPRARIEIKELLKELRTMGKTILISSHILPELADFCNKIGIIEQGKMVVEGPVQEIMKRVRGGLALEIKLTPDSPDPTPLLTALPEVKGVQQEDGAYLVQLNEDETDVHKILQYLLEHNVKVASFSEREIDLEDIFMKVTKGIVS